MITITKDSDFGGLFATIQDCYSTYNSLGNHYAEGLSSGSSLSSMDFGSWNDDVASELMSFKDQLVQGLQAISNDLSGGAYVQLGSAIQALGNTVGQCDHCKQILDTLYSYKPSVPPSRKDKRYNSYQALLRRIKAYDDALTELVAAANSVLSQIPSITFNSDVQFSAPAGIDIGGLGGLDGLDDLVSDVESPDPVSTGGAQSNVDGYGSPASSSGGFVPTVPRSNGQDLTKRGYPSSMDGYKEPEEGGDGGKTSALSRLGSALSGADDNPVSNSFLFKNGTVSGSTDDSSTGTNAGGFFSGIASTIASAKGVEPTTGKTTTSSPIKLSTGTKLEATTTSSAKDKIGVPLSNIIEKASGAIASGVETASNASDGSKSGTTTANAKNKIGVPLSTIIDQAGKTGAVTAGLETSTNNGSNKSTLAQLGSSLGSVSNNPLSNSILSKKIDSTSDSSSGNNAGGVLSGIAVGAAAGGVNPGSGNTDTSSPIKLSTGTILGKDVSGSSTKDKLGVPSSIVGGNGGKTGAVTSAAGAATTTTDTTSDESKKGTTTANAKNKIGVSPSTVIDAVNEKKNALKSDAEAASTQTTGDESNKKASALSKLGSTLNSNGENPLANSFLSKKGTTTEGTNDGSGNASGIISGVAAGLASAKGIDTSGKTGANSSPVQLSSGTKLGTLPGYSTEGKDKIGVPLSTVLGENKTKNALSGVAANIAQKVNKNATAVSAEAAKSGAIDTLTGAKGGNGANTSIDAKTFTPGTASVPSTQTSSEGGGFFAGIASALNKNNDNNLTNSGKTGLFSGLTSSLASQNNTTANPTPAPNPTPPSMTTPTPSPEPTVTPTPTPEPTPTPLPTETVTPLPTETPTPKSTRAPSESKATPEPTPTPSPSDSKSDKEKDSNKSAPIGGVASQIAKDNNIDQSGTSSSGKKDTISGASSQGSSIDAKTFTPGSGDTSSGKTTSLSDLGSSLNSKSSSSGTSGSGGLFSRFGSGNSSSSSSNDYDYEEIPTIQPAQLDTGNIPSAPYNPETSKTTGHVALSNGFNDSKENVYRATVDLHDGQGNVTHTFNSKAAYEDCQRFANLNTSLSNAIESGKSITLDYKGSDGKVTPVQLEYDSGWGGKLSSDLSSLYQVATTWNSESNYNTEYPITSWGADGYGDSVYFTYQNPETGQWDDIRASELLNDRSWIGVSSNK